MNDFSVTAVTTAVPGFAGYTVRSPGKPRRIASLADFSAHFGEPPPGLYLYDSLRLFFLNGGGDAWVASTGPIGKVKLPDLLAGLDVLGSLPEVTALVIPDGNLLGVSEYAALANAMLAQCAGLQSRVAILDVPSGLAPDPRRWRDQISEFRAGLATAGLSYGAVYYPWLRTANGPLPPSGAIAGLYAMVDSSRGIWMAPANVGIAGATGTTFDLEESDQESLAIDVAGKSINALRSFPGRGLLVWGAHTLDGNSQDFRYINVRRTLIMIEQTIKLAVSAYVFEPNVANTWIAVESMLINFLTNLWKQGALAGAKPDEAFSVQVGLGSTMTGQDILAGRMNVAVLVAITHPAEFIEITLSQQLQSATIPA
jgi:phage tail sheath protein FI